VAYYTSLGFILPAGAVAGYMIGWVLDRWLHSSPILAVVLGFIGAAGGFLEVFALLKRGEKNGDGPAYGPGPS
jgi:F0F1-type ATP synthase assembly protein I